MSYTLPGYTRPGYTRPHALTELQRRPVPRRSVLGSSGDGLGQVTGQDIASIASLAAGLISNPDATLARQGPAIVNAVELRLVGPLMRQTIRDYVLPYFGPPLLVLYAMTGMAMWSSYTVLNEFRAGKVRANGRRSRRAR